MTQHNNVILCSTIHDPTFALKNLLKSTLPLMEDLFSKMTVCCTAATNDALRNLLIREGFEVSVSSSMRQVDTYTDALRAALECNENSQAQKIFFIDFDRLAHWLDAFPNELIKLFNNSSNVNYLHVGRSSRAYDTHPPTQKKTEVIINEIGSKILGFKQTKDILSACSIFTKELGDKILQVNNVTAKGFYGTWPILLWTWASKKEYIEVEGLEWETPDRFSAAISMYGYEEWLKQFQTPDEWEKRVGFVHDFLIELNQLTELKIRENFKK